MAKVIAQNIPPAIAGEYDSALQRATLWKAGGDIYQVRKRYPFRLPQMQNDSVHSPSLAQRRVRAAFSRCVNCFNIQPETGGVVPPNIGPRDRSWWFNAAAGSGLWYYDFFISQSWYTFFGGGIPDWCKIPCVIDAFVGSANPDFNFGLATSLHVLVDNGVFLKYRRSYLRKKYPDKNRYLAVHCNDLTENNITAHYILARGVENHTWDQTLITWNNAPPIGLVLEAQTLVYPGWNHFYIGDYSSVVLMVTPEWEPPEPPWYYWDTSFESSEALDPSKRPYFYRGAA